MNKLALINQLKQLVAQQQGQTPVRQNPVAQPQQLPPTTFPSMGTLFTPLPGQQNPIIEQTDYVTEEMKPDGTFFRQATRKTRFQWWKGQE